MRLQSPVRFAVVGGFVFLISLSSFVSIGGEASHPNRFSAVCTGHIFPPPFEPEWVSPTGFYDLDHAWYDEPYAIDNDTETKACCPIDGSGWVWTPWLELTLTTPIRSMKIRFYAWYDQNHCNVIDVEVCCDGRWASVFVGGFMNHQWVEKPCDLGGNVTGAKVRFYVHRWLLSHVVADLHDFQFYQIG